MDSTTLAFVNDILTGVYVLLTHRLKQTTRNRVRCIDTQYLRLL